MTAILPCAKCGGIATTIRGLRLVDGKIRLFYQVVCLCGMVAEMFDKESTAIMHWNACQRLLAKTSRRGRNNRHARGAQNYGKTPG